MKKLLSLTLISSLLLSACSTMNQNAEKEEARNKKVAEINLELGMAYLARGDVQRSKQKFLYAQQKAPNLPEVWYSIAYFQEQTGNKVLAEENYLKALKLAPKRGDVLNNYGTYLCRTGRYAESIQYFERAAKDAQYLDTASAYENAGLCSQKIPNHAQAKNYFNLALESDPTRTVSMEELSKLN